MIYEYSCPIGHEFEASAKLVDAHLPALCGCGALAKRILSPTRTTFVHCDTNRRIKQIKQMVAKE